MSPIDDGDRISGSHLNRIEAYRFGNIRIGSRSYGSDVIIWPDRVVDGWWRKQGHSLCPEDLEEVMAGRPARLVVGTGASGVMRVPESTRRWLESKGVELMAAPTGEAVQIWNRWLDDGIVEGAVAALHLTC